MRVHRSIRVQGPSGDIGFYSFSVQTTNHYLRAVKSSAAGSTFHLRPDHERMHQRDGERSGRRAQIAARIEDAVAAEEQRIGLMTAEP